LATYDASAEAPVLDGVGLLERAISYALGSLSLVTPEAMANPTPCRDWDLRALLRHLHDSLTALHEAVCAGRIELDGGEPDSPYGDPVTALRSRAGELLGTCARTDHPDVVSVAGHPLATGLVLGVGAVEVAVHGWDVARACGVDRKIPVALAEELLPLLPFLVTDADRPARFAAPVALPLSAGPGDRLLAFLGRDPR
jgi:uncharacterized protein (TIGR03086 family)